MSGYFWSGRETAEAALVKVLRGYGRMRIVVEASPLAEWVSRLLEKAGHEVVIIDPRAAKHLVSSKKKTDARDARTLAKLCRSGWYTAVHRKSERSRELRSRLQARQALMKVKRQMGSAIRGLLRTVPWVGGQLSTAFRATIDDPHRFRRGEELADYVGLAPRVYQSGEVEYRGRITREGDKLLRWLLVEAAHNLLTRVNSSGGLAPLRRGLGGGCPGLLRGR